MESMFQNCVSEFDLNLFEQTTNVNQATPLKPCPEAQQLGIARLKKKVKSLSQVVHRAKHIDEVLLVLEKELLETEQELKETKSLLTEKIEENKVICEERNTYYNQVTENAIEITNLKEQVEKVKNQEYDTKLKDRIINGYSEQVKALQKELEDLSSDKKQNEKKATSALKQSKGARVLVERKLIRVLREYVKPTIKKRDKWLDSLIKRYLPDANKNEEESKNKIEKPEEVTQKLDETIIDYEDPSTPAISHRNTSVDFEYVESVDTGRGSSLAFSDGEKSFHSPDYYVNDSPPCAINNICNKCNISRVDASTSPASPERSGDTDILTTNVCEKCVLTKNDACTSPIPISRLDSATNTSGVSFEEIAPDKDVTLNSEENDMNIELTQITRTTSHKETASTYNDVSSEHTGFSNKKSILNKLEDFTFDTDDDDEASNGSGFASPIDELSTEPPVPIDEVVTSQTIYSKEAPNTVDKLLNNVEFNSDVNDESIDNFYKDQNHVDESRVISPKNVEAILTSPPEKETVSVKQQGDNEVMHDVNQSKSHIFSPVDFNDSESSCTNITCNEPPPAPTKSPDRTSDAKINTKRKSLQELECLEINNSKNCNNNVEIDMEIHKILNKMRLRHKMITPIPATPPQRITHSPNLPVENSNVTFSQQAQVITETINDQMDLLRVKVQEVFTSFVKTMPQYFEQIPRLFSRGDLNEDLLRNLLHDPNRSYKRHSYNRSESPSYNNSVQTELNKGLQPNVVELNTDSMLCLTETSENERSVCNDHTVLDENSVKEYQVAYMDNDKSQEDEICHPDEELAHENNCLLKSNESDCVFPVNDCCITAAHENTLVSLADCAEIDNNKLASIATTSLATTSSPIMSRNSIAFEGKDVSDDEDDVLISDLAKALKDHNKNSDKKLRNRKGKKEKMTKLETMRLKMLPKSKIKNDDTKTVKKSRSRPIPTNTIPKKKVKESDTAASLNDKSVYENAVAAFKLAKELKVVVKDCEMYKHNISTSDSDSSNCVNKTAIDSKIQSPTNTNTIKNKRKLSGSHTPDSKDQTDMKKDKRNSISLDDDVSNKSPKTIKKKRNDITPRKLSCKILDKELLSPKRTHEVLNSSSEMKEPKRKKMSVSDVQNSDLNSKCRDELVGSVSPRILRSASHIKLNIENGFEKPVVAENLERLRSKSDQMKPDTKTNIISLGRKSRITRKSTRLGSECMQEEQNSSVVCDNIPRKESNTIVSVKFCNDDTQDSTNNTNDLDIHASTITPSKRKARIARHITRTESKNVQDKLNSPGVSDSQRNKHNRAVSCSDVILSSNESIQKETVNKNHIDIHEDILIPLGRKPRIARLSSRLEFRNTTDKLNDIATSDISQEENNKTVSYADLNSLSNEGNEDETVNRNNVIHDNKLTPLGRKPRVARLSSRLESRNIIDKPNGFAASDISKDENNKTVSYADLNLFSYESNDDETVNKSNVAVHNKGKKPRIARLSSHVESRNTTDNLNGPNASDISRDENSRTVSYADLSLFSNEDNQDPVVENKRMESVNPILTEEHTIVPNKIETDNNKTLERKSGISNPNERLIASNSQELHSSKVPEVSKNTNSDAISYEDLNLFCEEDSQDQFITDRYRKDSLLCSMIQKYGVQKMKFAAKQPPESKVTDICQKLETSLSEILEVPHDECTRAMKKLVMEIRGWNVKHFVHGFIKYLKEPERKIELYSKAICPPFPPMTKKEQVLLYVLDELQKSYDYRNIVQKILINIEYTLFAINKTAETFDVIETMAHFYALLCRSYQKISQLRLFVIDAMYCLQLKSVILVQQCLEVWMSVLPLGHMGLAKCPLVTCLVYLLHFYKCEDKFNRVQDIRNTLRWKYNYEMSDWNENKILDVFRTAVIEIRDSPMERKTLRLSLLILAKRHGAKWCHNNIVKNLLQPLINDSSTTDRTKRFCVSLLGPLLKPYPSNMKVHYEMVIDYLMDMLNRKNSLKMQEAIISSLIYVDKNNNRFHQYLAKWCPNQVSPEFQLVFKDYVRSKTVHVWKQILSWQFF